MMTLNQRKDNGLVVSYCEYLNKEDKEGDYTFQVMPPYGDVSYKILRNGEFSHYATTRVRDTAKGLFKQERLPLSKHTFAYWAWNELGIKTVYLLEWSDGRGFLELWNKPNVVDTVIHREEDSRLKDIYILYDYELFTLF